MHCWDVCYDNTWTTGYKSNITPLGGIWAGTSTLPSLGTTRPEPTTCIPARSLQGVSLLISMQPLLITKELSYTSYDESAYFLVDF